MPLYEYECSDCGHITEVLSKVGDANAELVCGGCNGTKLKKKLSVTTIPTHPTPKGGKTCCGRDERCDAPPCGTSCCSG